MDMFFGQDHQSKQTADCPAARRYFTVREISRCSWYSTRGRHVLSRAGYVLGILAVAFSVDSTALFTLGR